MWLVASALVLLGSALAPPARAVEAGWGLTRKNPVEVCRAAGQRAWLQQRRCADGSELSWRRSGNVGPRIDLPSGLAPAGLDRLISGQPLGEDDVDHHATDTGHVDCGGKVQQLYLHMYHCGLTAPRRAPAGFLFVAAEPVSSVC